MKNATNTAAAAADTYHVRTAISRLAEAALIQKQAELQQRIGRKVNLPEVTRHLLETALIGPEAAYLGTAA